MTEGYDFRLVRCARCGGIYDVGKVEVTGRYVDCSVWKAPCCGAVVDDRGETGWKSRKDYYKLTVAEAADYRSRVTAGETRP